MNLAEILASDVPWPEKRDELIAFQYAVDPPPDDPYAMDDPQPTGPDTMKALQEAAYAGKLLTWDQYLEVRRGRAAAHA